ncbi:aldehyde dehydrogenase [Brevibacillus daliensis]|uniref:aldehyde dehydrogenase n=1 Tax=Brevibacillus daliensis TaxID=2892995 RepID=UPI001E386481|nr:aldehyde dehydrogenase [Brevibacillus daliensis]
MTSIQSLTDAQRKFFYSHQTKDLSFRIQSLQTLRQVIKKYEIEITEALHADLHKSEFESYSTEIGFILSEIGYTCKHLRSWASPMRVKTPLTHFGTSGWIHHDPYGVALIIAPWNYPFQLAIGPLIGAIAAGNCAIIKPSEMAPHTAAVVNKIVSEAFPPEFVAVVEGGRETSQRLLAEPFDYIFFTGSAHVGKVVMEAAAKHLTPLTLELGGKSPCIIHRDANLKVAAKRIAWGKFMNAGQTCIAPDYLLINAAIKEEFLSILINEIKGMYPDALTNSHFSHIINKNHFDRLTEMIDQEKVLTGGKSNESSLAIEPTVLDQVTWQDKVMQEEIFGPILPVLTYEHLEDAIKMVQEHPKPLALYIFSESSQVQEQIMSQLSFGGGCINDTIYHITNPNLPFGGVGNSGTGSYHGQSSFKTFSHQKSVLKHTTLFDIPVRYHTTKNALQLVKKFFK